MASLLDLLLGYRSPLDLLPAEPQGVRTAGGGMSLADILKGSEVHDDWHPLQTTHSMDQPADLEDVRNSLWAIVDAAGMDSIQAPGISAHRPEIKAPKSSGRVLYHGSQTPIAGKFDPAKATNYYSQVLGVPTFFFTDNKAMASSYGPAMTRASVKMRRPLEIDAHGKTFDEILPAIEDGLGIYRNKAHKKWAEEFKRIEAQHGEESVQMGTAPREAIERLDKMHADAMAQPESKQFSHDGVVIKNVWDWGVHQPSSGKYKPYGSVYMALSPKQINMVDSRPGGGR